MMRQQLTLDLELARAIVRPVLSGEYGNGS